MEAITVNYVENTDDWSVSVAGMGEELTERAPGIIAARDQAEQLIESLKPETGETAVVHLLRGSALEFTTAYMTARLSRDTGEATDPADDAVVPEQADAESPERAPATDSRATDETDEPAAAQTPAVTDDSRDSDDGHGDDSDQNDENATARADSAQQLAQ